MSYVVLGTGNDVYNGSSGPHWGLSQNGNLVYYLNGNDTVYGGSGNDKINGKGGHDELYGGSGHDTLDGGSGNDELYGDSGNDKLNGGSGNDKLYGGSGNDTFQGHGGVDYFNGGLGIDRINYSYSSGGWEIDLISQKAKSLNGSTVENFSSIERVFGSQGNDLIYGNNKNNDLEGEKGNDFISGNGGKDTLEGEKGNDYLTGGSSQDKLVGGNDNDTLIGGSGGDFLTGNSGSDRFKYLAVSDSPYTNNSVNHDLITDFNVVYDRIDLSSIDANITKGGNQAFNFKGTDPMSGGGEVRYFYSGQRTIVHIDREGDGNLLPDMQIELKGIFNLAANDFIL